MNRRMLRLCTDSLRGVDLLLLMIDGSAAFGAGENFVLELLKQAGMPSLLLINKIDKIAKPKLLPLIQRYADAYSFSGDHSPVGADRRQPGPAGEQVSSSTFPRAIPCTMRIR